MELLSQVVTQKEENKIKGLAFNWTKPGKIVDNHSEDQHHFNCNSVQYYFPQGWIYIITYSGIHAVGIVNKVVSLQGLSQLMSMAYKWMHVWATADQIKSLKLQLVAVENHKYTAKHIQELRRMEKHVSIIIMLLGFRHEKVISNY